MRDHVLLLLLFLTACLPHGFAQKIPSGDTALFAKAQLPPRNEKLLATIPKKRMDSVQLKAWLADFSKKISPTLSSGGAQHSHLNTNTDPTCTGAVFTMLEGDQLSAIQQALDITRSSPDDLSGLSNLAGILIASDLPSRAIPILEYVDSVMPGNATVENNLGQAYMALGDDKKAETWLQQTVEHSQHHPLANRTLAYIFLSRHDKARALEYLKESIKGGFTPEAWGMLKDIENTDPARKDKISLRTKLMDLVRPRYHGGETFNFKGYIIPPQCRKVSQVVELQKAYEDYKEMLDVQRKKYESLQDAEKKYTEANGQAFAAEARKLQSQLNPQMTMSQMLQQSRAISASVQKMMTRVSGHRPCGSLAAAMIADLQLHYVDDILLMNKRDSLVADSINKYLADFDTAQAQIVRSFQDREDKFGEGNPDVTIGRDRCREINKYANEYMGRIADLVEDRTKDRVQKEKDFFNDVNYWSYLASADDHAYKDVFYGLVTHFISEMGHLADTHFLYCFSHVENDSAQAEESNELSFTEVLCPILKQKREFKTTDARGEEHTLGEVSANCEEFKISGSPASKSMGNIGFSATKNYATGESVISMSAGLGTKKSVWIFKDALDAGSSLTPSLVLGGPGGVNDITLKYEIHLKVLGEENSAGYTISYQHGWSFVSKGKLMERLARWGEDILGVPHEAQQMNKNVKRWIDSHPNGR